MTQSRFSDPAKRLGQRYYFNDPDMDLFFVGAMSWGPTGGLDIGQVYYIGSQIADGDADSWVAAFSDYGAEMNAQADTWKAKGWTQATGEARLKAAAAYRSAWQFAEVGATFLSIYARERAAFKSAVAELCLPASFFDIPYKAAMLPGVFLQNPKADAPVIVVIGGADTGYEDLFLSVGRNLWQRGYSVAIADLPGQGRSMGDGLHWEAEAERPIGLIIDHLIDHHGAVPGRIALLGLSLGGYFVTRAAGYEDRFAAVIASTPFPNPGEMWKKGLAASLSPNAPSPTAAALRARQIMLWKLGATSPDDMLARTAAMQADPSRVTVPFLSIVGGGESEIFREQAEGWHRAIPSAHKALVRLGAETGADGHCQINNRLRLAQEVCGWLFDLGL